MENINILGFTLKEGLELVKEETIKNIKLVDTHTTKKNISNELSEPRILRVTELRNKVVVVVGYF